MKRRRALGAALVLLALQAAFGANEASFLELWKIHERDPSLHDDLIARCRNFVETNAGDPLCDIVKSLKAWHLLAAGRGVDAWPIFENQAAQQGAGVPSAASRVAKGWISRRERQKVAASLKLYYREEIAFPKELAEISIHPKIPANAHPPVLDAFGVPWKYSLAGFEKIPEFKSQKYSLECVELGPLSDLEESLKLRYAGHIKITPTRIQPGANGGSVVNFQFSDSKGTVLIEEGLVAKGIQLAYVGKAFLVVCDATHWRVFEFQNQTASRAP